MRLESWRFRIKYIGWMNLDRCSLLITVHVFSVKAQQAEAAGASEERLMEIRGRNRAKKGIYEGDFEEGMFEAGQSSGLIKDIIPVEEVFRRIIGEYGKVRSQLPPQITET